MVVKVIADFAYYSYLYKDIIHLSYESQNDPDF